jgi:HNH endonuclease/NUMOD4 motif
MPRRSRRSPSWFRKGDAVEDIEVWLVIPSLPWLEASSSGRIRRIATPNGRGCIGKILKPQPKKGYLVITVNIDGLEKKRRVHVLVAEAFYGPCPPGKEVNHKDKQRSNCAVSNLEYLTRSENHKHAYANGRSPSPPLGERSSAAKLNRVEVEEIRLSKEPAGVLSLRFKVSRQAIWKIRTKRTWNH